MIISFRRITSTGNFIPEIDGLRFIAIASVVLFHLNGFILEKDLNQYAELFNYQYLSKLLSHGHLGVPLFFVISGFILGKPFASYHIKNTSPINLKAYFLRRITRLEPPYIIVMTFLFFGAVLVAKTLPWNDALFSYLSSVLYTHNILYGIGTLPLLNAVTWSLEIEIQFYLLAPILSYLFAITNVRFRRILILLLSLLFLVMDYLVNFPFLSILNYMEYFLIGFLLADLYISNVYVCAKTRFDGLIGLTFLVVIWIFEKSDFIKIYMQFGWEAFQLTCIFFLFYYILIHKELKILTKNVFTIIGGMCYSIYLLHYPIISIIGNPLVRFRLSTISIINVGLYCLIMLGLILLISSVFFILIERPCMNKDWPKKVFPN